MDSITEELGDLALFEGCVSDDLKLVADAVTGIRRVVDGEVICSEGEKADRWWIVIDGMADVTVSGLYAATIGPGETIGELALLDGEPRGATVTATTGMVLHEVNGEEFVHALLASPRLSLALLRELAVRLRRTNERPPGDDREIRASLRSAAATGPPRQRQIGDLNPRAGDYFADPYDQLEAIRESTPVLWSELFDSYLVTRYEDVRQLCRHPALTGSITTGRPVVNARTGEAPRPGRTDKMMIRRDGEDHTRLRRLVSRVFTPRAIQRWRDTAQTIVDRQLQSASERGEIDVIAEYALPLPAQVISDMLGIPHDDIAKLREWSSTLVSNLEPLTTQEQQQRIEVAGRAIFRYLEDLIADKRSHPADDILTALLEAEESGDCLDDEEVQAQVLLLYIAGHETTVNLIGNGVTHLFRFPDQLDRLRADPGLDANAVEEVLRYDSPAQFTRRINHESIEIDGTTIPAESYVTLALSSANRDPRKWGPSAGAFDIARAGANEHVSFGGGPHYCLGASLARLEAQIALPALVRRFPRLQPAYREPAWGERVILRGVQTLPVTLR
jgi:cytochrome P450